jgi:hypothetical protein
MKSNSTKSIKSGFLGNWITETLRVYLWVFAIFILGVSLWFAWSFVTAILGFGTVEAFLIKARILAYKTVPDAAPYVLAAIAFNMAILAAKD